MEQTLAKEGRHLKIQEEDYNGLLKKVQRYEESLKQVVLIYESDLTDIQVLRKVKKIAKEALEK
jgi:hypothetical protein